RSSLYRFFHLFSLDIPPRSDTSTLSLHDALPICRLVQIEKQRHANTQHDGELKRDEQGGDPCHEQRCRLGTTEADDLPYPGYVRSEEHTSELQSRENLVCRLLLEKKNIK